MHYKLRNNLISLGAAFAVVVSGSFFGEPLPLAGASDATPTVMHTANISPEARIALALLGATVSIAQARAEIEAAETDAVAENKTKRQIPASRPSIKSRHKRPALGMPYFSFASFLPRAPQES